MTWRREDPQGNEAGKIKWELVRWTRGRGLDIGAGPVRTFNHFITVDNNVDAILFNIPMPRPDLLVADAGNLDVVADESMEYAFSSHLLEHIEPERIVKVLREWWRTIKVGGSLILYVPDEDEYPKIGEEGANTDHKWNVSYNEVMRLMHKTKVPFDLMDFQKRNSGMEYSLYFVFKKCKDGERPRHFHHDRPRPTGKTCGLVRYGAIGDMLQAASVLAALKEEGYHITLYCAEGPGEEAIRGNPHVDEYYIQGRGQVTDQQLQEFWANEKPKYDKWVNLCESVEGGLLAMTGRPVDTYDPAVRHAMLDWNYVERQHLIAGVPDAPHRIHFYPTAEEEKWAKTEKKAFGSFVIVWSLAGSSVHKVYPWLDNVVSGLLIDFPEIAIVFVGGKDGVLLERGWELATRVHRRSGKYSVRESLSLVQQADVVIGCETGMLNSVAMEEMPKVIFLSHSTQENLTKYWTSTHSLASVGTHCLGRGKDEAPACHRLHHGWTRCTEAPPIPGTEKDYARPGSGVAQCQWDIGAQDAYKVIWHVVQWRLEEYAKRAGLPAPGVMQMSVEEANKTRLTFPEHLRNPDEVVKAEAANDTRSVIEV